MRLSESEQILKTINNLLMREVNRLTQEVSQLTQAKCRYRQLLKNIIEISDNLGCASCAIIAQKVLAEDQPDAQAQEGS